MIWFLFFISSVLVFFLIKSASIQKHYLSGLTLAFLGIAVEFSGQSLGLWETKREILEFARAPLFLIAAYFFLGMLIAALTPKRPLWKMVFLAAIVAGSSAVEQLLIKLNYFAWGIEMNLFICLLLHTLVISAVMWTGKFSRNI